MTVRRYNLEELEWIREHYTLTIADMCKRFAEVFGRTPGAKGLCQKRASLGLGVRRNGVNLRRVVGNSRPRREIGFEAIRNGLLWRKVVSNKKGRWKLVHRIKWEEMHGPIPACMVLRCRTVDKLNTDPHNWDLVSPSMMPALNGSKGRMHYDEASLELKPVLMNLARLEDKMRSVARGKPA